MIDEKHMLITQNSNVDDFLKLLDLNYSKVYYHCLKIMKNDCDASDVTQNTFIKAFINIKFLKNFESFGAWIFTICNNEIKLFYRKNKNIAVLPSETNEKPSYKNLYSAIDTLDEKFRNLLILKYFSDFKLREIAELTGLNEKIIKSRLFEARKKLKTLLSDDSALKKLSHNKERRFYIMCVVKLLDLGARVVPCMSVWGQKELLKCTKNNTKFTDEVLSELSKIEKGNEFVMECQGHLSYEEFVKILACCDEAVLYRLNGQDYKTWRNGKDNPFINDIADYLNSGGYVDSIETILYVPSIIDTVKWYKKYLNWNGCTNEEEINKYGYSQVCAYDSESAEYMYKSFKGLHLRFCENNEEATKGSCFVFVTSIEKLRSTIINNGWEKLTEIRDNGWGTKGFNLEDLNGFVLEFCEWTC